MITAGSKIVRGAIVVSVCKLLGKVLGFGQSLIIAYCYGTGLETDAFFLAFKNIISGLMSIPQQILQPFLPLFVDKREKEGEPAAWRFASSVAFLLIALLALLVLAGLIAAPSLVAAIENSPDPALAGLTTTLVRWMLPSAIFAGLFSLLYLILNSYKNFAVPALGDVVNKLLLLALTVALYRWMGIAALALGVVAGALACLIFQGSALWRKFAFIRGRIDLKDPALRKLLWLMLPLLLGTLLSQARGLIDVSFASGMGKGCISSLTYARTITDTLTLLVPYAVGIAIFPFFSDYAAKGDRAGLAQALMTTSRIIAFLFIPLSVALILLREPLVQLVFERGKFGADSVALTTGPLACYSFGLTAFALEIIIMAFFFALKDTWTPILVGIVTLAVHIGILLGLQGVLGHNSIALALSLSRTLKVVILLFLLQRKRFDFQWSRQFLFLAKALLAAAVMGIAIYLVHGAITASWPVRPGIGQWHKTLRLALLLGAAVLAGVLAYTGGSWLCRVEEIRYLVRRRTGAKPPLGAA